MLFVAALITCALAGLLLFYFAMPVLSFGFYGLPVIILSILAIAMFFFLDYSIDLEGKKPAKPKASNPQKDKALKWILILCGVILFYLTAIPLVTTWGAFYSKKYRNQIGEVKVGKNFTSTIAPISLEQVRVVDQQLASLLGEKVLGSQTALGSQVSLGIFNIQKVNGKLYWVAPLLHSGFFKWNKNSEGTPGYVMVSATNERDVKLVQEVNGQPIKIKYQPNAYFFSNIERYLYFNGYASRGTTDYSFELDEAGNPYWVVTIFEKAIGFSGKNAVGVAIINAQNGEIHEYDIKSTPSWVDRIQPEDIIQEQLNMWGKLVHGYWNFSNKDELSTTENLSLVYGADGRSYWYTGLTSVGADESTVGFVLVDTRTKETIWYKQPGATEYAAQTSAEGKVQEKKYKSTLPIPYNINGIPTYVSTLKDDAGLVKMYAMVAIEDYTIVGVGNSMREALLNYKNTFNMAGNRINASSESKKFSIRTKVARFAVDIKNGDSFYYIQVTDKPKLIFVGTSQISNYLPVTNVGDSIAIMYDEESHDLIDLSSFTNISITK